MRPYIKVPENDYMFTVDAQFIVNNFPEDFYCEFSPCSSLYDGRHRCIPFIGKIPNEYLSVPAIEAIHYGYINMLMGNFLSKPDAFKETQKFVYVNNLYVPNILIKKDNDILYITLFDHNLAAENGGTGYRVVCFLLSEIQQNMLSNDEANENAVLHYLTPTEPDKLFKTYLNGRG